MSQNGQQFAADTSKRTILQWCKGLLVLFIGLTIAHLGVAMFLVSALGTDTFTIFIEGLAGTVGLSIGTCHVAVCILIMVLLLIFTKGYVKPGTIVCAFFGGWIIDLFLFLLGKFITAGSPIALRVAVMLLGCVVLSLGMSVVIKSNSGTGPNDLVAVVLTDKINAKKHRMDFRWVRICCDVFFIAIGVLLGGTLGIGTVAAAFLTGPVVQFFLPRSERLIHRIFPDI